MTMAVPTTTKGNRHKGPEVLEIAASKLTTDERVQRGLIPGTGDAPAEALDLDSIGVITVSQRSPKELVIIDGQHRIAALLPLNQAHDRADHTPLRHRDRHRHPPRPKATEVPRQRTTRSYWPTYGKTSRKGEGPMR